MHDLPPKYTLGNTNSFGGTSGGVHTGRPEAVDWPDPAPD